MNARLIKLCMLITILSPKICFSDPAIDTFSKSGSTITITGRSFGNKSPVAPILWEQFENYTPGHLLKDDNPRWLPYYQDKSGYLIISNSCYTGSNCIKYQYILGGANANIVGSTFTARERWAFISNAYDLGRDDSRKEVYFSYNVKADLGGTAITNLIGKLGRGVTASYANSPAFNTDLVKSFQYSTPGTVGISSWNVHWTSSNGVSASEIYICNNPTTDMKAFSSYCTNLGAAGALNNASWTRHEMWERLSTPGVKNGARYYRLNNKEYNYINEATLAAGVATDTAYRYAYIGGDATNISATPLGGSDAYSLTQPDNGPAIAIVSYTFDNIYVDDTKARVEICSGNTWVNRGNCEIQIPKDTWFDTGTGAPGSAKITITTNKGNYPVDSSVFLYVIDSSGIANSTGYPLKITADWDPKLRIIDVDVTKP